MLLVNPLITKVPIELIKIQPNAKNLKETYQKNSSFNFHYFISWLQKKSAEKFWLRFLWCVKHLTLNWQRKIKATFNKESPFGFFIQIFVRLRGKISFTKNFAQFPRNIPFCIVYYSRHKTYLNIAYLKEYLKTLLQNSTRNKSPTCNVK